MSQNNKADVTDNWYSSNRYRICSYQSFIYDLRRAPHGSHEVDMMSYYWAHGTVAKYGRKWERMRCDKCVTKSRRCGNYCTNKEIRESRHEKGMKGS